MRKGNRLLAAVLAATVFGGVAVAQTPYASTSGANGTTIIFEAPNLATRQTVQDLVEELMATGFTYIEIRRTFLGRARFVAYSATEKREIVMNPTTGELLRNLVQESTENPADQANPSARGAGNNGNGNGNNGNGNNGNGNNGNGNGNSGNGNSGNNGNGNGNGNNGNGNN